MMPAVFCSACDRVWEDSGERIGAKTKCPFCRSPIEIQAHTAESPTFGIRTIKSRGDVCDSDGPNARSLVDTVAEEETRLIVNESRNASLGVAATIVGLFIVGIALERDLRVARYVVWSVIGAWTYFGAMLLVWYRTSQAGDYEAQLVSYCMRMRSADARYRAGTIARRLVGSGIPVVIVASAFARGLEATGAGNTGLMMIVAISAIAGLTAAAVGAVWLMAINFKSIRVAGVSRVYCVLSIVAVIFLFLKGR